MNLIKIIKDATGGLIYSKIYGRDIQVFPLKKYEGLCQLKTTDIFELTAQEEKSDIPKFIFLSFN